MSSPDMPSPEARPPSLQRRLALELSVALGLILVALFLTLDGFVDRELYARMDANLLERSRTIVAFVQARHKSGFDKLGHLLPEYELPEHTDFFEIWNADGTTRLRSSSSAGQALARPPNIPADNQPVYFDTVRPDGHSGRAVATVLHSFRDDEHDSHHDDDKHDSRRAGDERKLLVVATERESHDWLERRLHYLLMGGIALALVLAVSIASLAVRRGLAPLLRFGRRIAKLDGTQPPTLANERLPRELEPFSAALGAAFDKLYATIERERRFSRDVAHELRTPLAEIRTSIETAARIPADRAATQAAFAASIGAVERMQRAIDALLMLARHEAGLARPALDPLHLSALLKSLLASLEPLARERSIHFASDCPPDLWVRSDIGSLERIVANLLHNAIEYAPPGSRVEIGVETLHDGGLALSVANPAPDLCAADLDQIGRRFWRKSPSGGTAAHAGLGLALALALARSLGLELDFSLHQPIFRARLQPLQAL
jgi:two-component system sensor histidine kinase QseC